MQYPDVKFLRAISDETIPNYPDKNLPTILVYKKGEIVCQMIGLVQLGGTEKDLTMEEVEFQLGVLGGTWPPAKKKPTRSFKVNFCSKIMHNLKLARRLMVGSRYTTGAGAWGAKMKKVRTMWMNRLQFRANKFIDTFLGPTRGWK